ncbi:MAG TPA: WG repeat-containing protein [Oscillospiraceae bacterium]|nr:WG repeat-containing protein [Oscillospiraceae bacterium]HPF56268.1 WG repeat-containing protein [Clostridiales bacterium]HPK35354.1 WG repeat-containing protein [Oscillospiraceae bacterium]HPR76803.1 WG repeat-containing protein [Oscillospiraceae bacterium]
MIPLLSLFEPGDKPHSKSIINPKKPAFWIIISMVVLITAAFIFLPNALKTPTVSEPFAASVSQITDSSETSFATETVNLQIPVNASVYQLQMTMADNVYINNIKASDDILTDEIYKPIQMQEFSGQLAQRFHFESDLYQRFSGYDEAYFQNKCVFALILRSTMDKICLFDGVEYAQAVQTASTSTLPDLLVSVSLKLADNGSEWVDADSWWLVLIELGDSGHAPSDFKLSGVFRNNDNSALPQQYATVMYYTEDGDRIDRYLIKNDLNGEKELCTVDGQHLLSGTDFYPLPHMIGVLSDDGWRLYDKTTLKPISGRVYEQLHCQQYPDDYWDPIHMTAKRGGLWVLLDGKGNELTDALYDAIYLSTYEEVWPIISVIQNGKYGAIGYDGKEIIPPQYDFLTMLVYSVEDTVFVRKDGKWGAITLDDQMNTSDPDWATQVPQELTENYALWEYSHSEDDLFTDDAGFKILGSADGKISDEQIAVYAVLHMKGYDYENGNTREEYDAITLKYFGKTLTDYTGGGKLEFIPDTDRIRAVGWSYDSSMFTMIKSLSKTDGKYYTGQYYCVNISDSVWDALPYDLAAVKQMIRDRNWTPLTQAGLTFELREVKFTLGQEEDGTYYPIFMRVKILESGLKEPVTSQ